MKKSKIAITLLAITFSSSLFNNNAEAAITNKPGDIIVTKSTNPYVSGKGLAGHTGIYISSTSILHIAGPGYPVKIISEKTWHSNYASSKVVRPNNATLGQKAADNAKKYFTYINSDGKRVGKKIPYFISPNPYDLTQTYCSELVWYSYYRAGKKWGVYEYNTLVPLTKINTVHPYLFIYKQNVGPNGFKYMDNTW